MCCAKSFIIINAHLMFLFKLANLWNKNKSSTQFMSIKLCDIQKLATKSRNQIKTESRMYETVTTNIYLQQSTVGFHIQKEETHIFMLLSAVLCRKIYWEIQYQPYKEYKIFSLGKKVLLLVKSFPIHFIFNFNNYPLI